MSSAATLIDAAHKLYAEAIGTANEYPAYLMLVATVRKIQRDTDRGDVKRDALMELP